MESPLCFGFSALGLAEIFSDLRPLYFAQNAVLKTQN